MKRVMIVDDSAVARELLTFMVESDPDLTVVKTVTDGEAAVKAVEKVKPDVITMDVEMPKMNGFEATRAIMETHPTPIVIITATFTPGDQQKTFQALQAGAVAILEKPRGVGVPSRDAKAREIVDTIKLMADVPVVTRWKHARPKDTTAAPPPPVKVARDGIQLVAVGASTGGPVALQTLLRKLGAPCPVPVVIVQHIASGFLGGMAEWLSSTTGHKVAIPTHGQQLEGGVVYLAPDGYQMGVDTSDRIVVAERPPVHGLRPSVSFLFESVADTFGPSAIGVLLTGMGRDGAEELKLMRDRGAVTIAQDEESSVVHGMPGEAIKLGGAVHVAPPERIAELIVKELTNHPSST